MRDSIIPHGHLTHSCDNECFSRGLSYGGRTPADLLIDIVAGRAYDAEDPEHVFVEVPASEHCFQLVYEYLINGRQHPSFQGDVLLDFGSKRVGYFIFKDGWVFADHCQRLFFLHDLEDVISAIDLPGGLLS
jgi:hypothetical protein